MINIINANTDLGVHIDGANLGANMLTKKLNVIKYNIDKDNIIKSKDKNDLKKNLNAINNFTKKIYDKELEILKDGNFPLLVGGDHSAVIGSALASRKINGNIGIIWIDAHGDYNTFKTTHSGNIHGLPLAAITGYDCLELTNFITNEYINPKKAVIVGARSIDPWEIDNIKNAGVTVFTTSDIKKYGVKNIMDKAFEIALNNTNGLHISYDIDVIDSKVAPGVSIPEINGISHTDAYEIMDYLMLKKHDIKSMDLVEYNPTRDIDNKTYIIAKKLLDKIIDEIN